MRLVARTQRWQILGGEHLRLMARDNPIIVVFWHETLPSMPIFWHLAKQAGMNRPGTALASRHRDGQLIGSVLGFMGIGQISGSSSKDSKSKGGAAGLRGLLRALAEGHNVALTPDGPRGPRRIAAPGVAQLAALSGAQVLPCGAWTSRAIALNSWDKMRLILPFGRARLVVGAPITVPREGWEAALPAIQSALNAVMDEAAQT